MKKIKNLLTSGCSFTSDGMGGVPPTKLNAGGCSFVSAGDYNATQPNSWPGFLAQQLKATSLFNTASSAHGNMLVANTLLECVNRFQYFPEDTVIVFNISEPARLDLICGYDHPDADHANVPWNKDFIPYTFIKRSSQLIVQLQKQLGFEHVEFLTSNCVEFLFNFLEQRGFAFYFLTMMDYNQSCLQKTLDKFSSHFISLDPGSNMIDFTRITNNQKSDKDFHPSVHGHELMAQQIYRRIAHDLHLSIL